MGAFYPPDDPGDALRSNPFDVAVLAAAIELALELDEERPAPPGRAHGGSQ
jgi:hypothetical protein